MRLYHYRPINSALLEISDGTLHFATREELNDPLEGYIRVFWQGDKAAWEGLFRNYVCSVMQAINLYFLQFDEEILHHKTMIVDLHYFDHVRFGQILKELTNVFLSNEEIQKLSVFYGDNRLKVYKEELQLILHFIHNKALTCCIRKCIDCRIIPEKMANTLLKTYSSNENIFPFELMEAELPDEVHRSKIARAAKVSIEDRCEFHYVKLCFDDGISLYGEHKDENEQIDNKDAITEARQRRNWMSIVVDFPRLYVEQLQNMLYPESYVVCFSGNNNDSAMWGNYADCHRGVCLIYETDDCNRLKIKGKNQTIVREVKPINYEGELLECNFFETFGRLTLTQIETWLTGVDELSSAFNAFSDEIKWRNRYWKAYETITYQKLKAWKHENEYRFALADTIYDLSDPKNRNLRYESNALKGVVFGINTSEYDKKRIMEKLLEHADTLTDFTFYQAEYDDESQSIIVRQKASWKLKE